MVKHHNGISPPKGIENHVELLRTGDEPEVEAKQSSYSSRASLSVVAPSLRRASWMAWSACAMAASRRA